MSAPMAAGPVLVALLLLAQVSAIHGFTGLGVLPRGVNAGKNHVCTWNDYTLQCFGLNFYGQLGMGTGTVAEGELGYYGHQENHISSHPGVQGAKWSSVCSGDWHTCGISLAGEVYCWGRGTNGATGQGHTDLNSMPGPVDLNLGIVRQISCGAHHTCAVVEGDNGVSVKCWGGWDWAPGATGHTCDLSRSKNDYKFKGDQEGEMGASLGSVDFGQLDDGESILNVHAGATSSCAGVVEAGGKG